MINLYICWLSLFQPRRCHFFFLWPDLEMSSRVKVVINELKWENKLLKTKIKEMHKVKDKKDRNDEAKDEVKEVDQHNSLKVNDLLGTDEKI